MEWIRYVVFTKGSICWSQLNPLNVKDVCILPHIVTQPPRTYIYILSRELFPVHFSCQWYMMKISIIFFSKIQYGGSDMFFHRSTFFTRVWWKRNQISNRNWNEHLPKAVVVFEKNNNNIMKSEWMKKQREFWRRKGWEDHETGLLYKRYRIFDISTVSVYVLNLFWTQNYNISIFY